MAASIVLIVLGGLPGTGKTTIARELTRQIDAVHVRIDSIEQTLRGSWPADRPLDDAGYRLAYAAAEENLRAGRSVIADSVNPLQITRDDWLAVARRAQSQVLEVEVVCSDAGEHRRRIEGRVTDIPGLRLPTWEEVQAREYHRWVRSRLVIDTAALSAEESAALIRQAISEAAK